jgi:hypothetical protein
MVQEQAYFWYDKNIHKVFDVLVRIIKDDKPVGFIMGQLDELKSAVLSVQSGEIKGYPASAAN